MSLLNNIAVSYENGKWKKLASKLSKEVLLKEANQVDRDGCFPKESIEALSKSGLLSIGVPVGMGGVGGDISTSTLVVEELAKGCPSTAMSYLMHISILPLLVRLATPEQKELLIRPIAEGKWLGSYSMSEKGSGSRLWHMDSYAVKKDNGYEVDSFKSFATSSGHCQFYLLAVKSSQESVSNELNIFMVDANDPNIKTIGSWDAMGLRGTSSSPVHFNKCLIPKERLFGKEGTGYNLVMAYTFPAYIIGLSAVYIGIAEKAYSAAKEMVIGRNYTENSSGLRDVEVIQRYISEMKVEIDQAKAYIDRVANLASSVTKVFDQLLEAEMLNELLENAQDDEFFLQLAQAKISACEMAVRVTNTAMQVCGGAGFKRGSIVEQCYRDARAGSVMGPSDDILKMIIGRRCLGLSFPWKD